MPSSHRTRLARVLSAFVAGTWAVAAHAACTGFGAAGGIAVVPSPQMLVAADFDRDGVLDLAVACGSGAPLAIVRGLAGGGFAAPVSYASGATGRGLAVGDLDGDANLDVAVCVSTGVAVWHGRGDGTFTGGGIVALGSAPRAAVCADFDEDGITDLAVASANTNEVLLARGGGADGVADGTFGAARSFPVGTNPARMVTADFDGDGILDLAVANNSAASVSILRGLGANGRGNGSFSPAANVGVAGSPWGLAVADVDRDGDPDLLASNGAGTTIAWLRNTGGAFANAATYTTALAPRDLATGDFDGDGRVDVAAACAAANVVTVLRGDGAGGFSALGNFAAANGAAGLVAGDWNGDGAPDLVSANPGANTLTRFTGTCPAAAGSVVTLLSPVGGESWWPGVDQRVRWAAAGGASAVDVELSRDGGASWRTLARGATGTGASVPATGAAATTLRVRVRDALVPARSDASASGFTLCGLFGGPIASPAGVAATQLASADLDGDGRADLVAVGAGVTRVLRGTGDGRFVPAATLASAPAVRVRLADATGDGLADLLVLGPDALALFAGDGAGGFGSPALVPVADGTDFVAGDFDEDGVTDFAVLAADGAGARLALLRGEAGGWNERAAYALAGAPGRLACADLDGDGIADLALEAGTTLQVWRGGGRAGRGDGTFALASSRMLNAAGGELVVGDTDGDGRADVGLCVPSTGDVWTYAGGLEAEGAPQLADAPVTSAVGPGPASPALADLDGDGRADLVVALAGEGGVAVLPGGAGGFGSARGFAGGGGAMVVADFTGDGSADAVVARGDSVVCLPSMCPPKVAAMLALARHDEPAAAIGFERRITWSRAASVALGRVELSRDDGAHWVTLADAVPGGRFAWTVTGPATDAARLRVSDASVAGRCDVTAPFAIRAPFADAGAGAVPAAATRLERADLDGDVLADALVTGAGEVALLRGAAGGTPTTVARFASPGVRDAHLADFDRDGLADLLVLDASAASVRRGLGGGAFGDAQFSATGLGNVACAIGDFDEDGTPDLAVAAGGAAPRVSILRGVAAAAGAIAFAPFTSIALPAPPTAIVAGDWNGDGIADLAVTHGAGLAVLAGNGTGGRGDGTFRVTGTRAFGSGALPGLFACDVDGDGVTDLAAPDSAARTFVLARGDGAGGFATPVAIAAPLVPRSLAVADADGDGFADVVLAGDAGTCVLRGTGAFADGAFAPAEGCADAAVALAFADADGDGRADLLVAGSDSLRVRRGAFGRARPAPRFVTLPDAAGVLPGEELAIAWSACGAPVDVGLSRDGGTHWERIASDVTGTSFRWTVTAPFTATARLRVRESNVPARGDTSAATFRIGPASLAAGASLPATFALSAPWPNPARGAVALTLVLPHAGDVAAEVLDVSGRRVRTLHRGALAAGTHALRWDGRTDAGSAAGPGLYFVRARTAGAETTRPVTLVR